MRTISNLEDLKKLINDLSREINPSQLASSITNVYAKNLTKKDAYVTAINTAILELSVSATSRDLHSVENMYITYYLTEDDARTGLQLLRHVTPNKCLSTQRLEAELELRNKIHKTITEKLGVKSDTALTPDNVMKTEDSAVNESSVYLAIKALFEAATPQQGTDEIVFMYDKIMQEMFEQVTERYNNGSIQGGLIDNNLIRKSVFMRTNNGTLSVGYSKLKRKYIVRYNPEFCIKATIEYLLNPVINADAEYDCPTINDRTILSPIVMFLSHEFAHVLYRHVTQSDSQIGSDLPHYVAQYFGDSFINNSIPYMVGDPDSQYKSVSPGKGVSINRPISRHPIGLNDSISLSNYLKPEYSADFWRMTTSQDVTSLDLNILNTLKKFCNVNSTVNVKVSNPVNLGYQDAGEYVAVLNSLPIDIQKMVRKTNLTFFTGNFYDMMCRVFKGGFSSNSYMRLLKAILDSLFEDIKDTSVNKKKDKENKGSEGDRSGNTGEEQDGNSSEGQEGQQGQEGQSGGDTGQAGEEGQSGEGQSGGQGSGGGSGEERDASEEGGSSAPPSLPGIPEDEMNDQGGGGSGESGEPGEEGEYDDEEYEPEEGEGDGGEEGEPGDGGPEDIQPGEGNSESDSTGTKGDGTQQGDKGGESEETGESGSNGGSGKSKYKVGDLVVHKATGDVCKVTEVHGEDDYTVVPVNINESFNLTLNEGSEYRVTGDELESYNAPQDSDGGEEGGDSEGGGGEDEGDQSDSDGGDSSGDSGGSAGDQSGASSSGSSSGDSSDQAGDESGDSEGGENDGDDSSEGGGGGAPGGDKSSGSSDQPGVSVRDDGFDELRKKIEKTQEDSKSDVNSDATEELTEEDDSTRKQADSELGDNEAKNQIAEDLQDAVTKAKEQGKTDQQVQDALNGIDKEQLTRTFGTDMAAQPRQVSQSQWKRVLYEKIKTATGYDLHRVNSLPSRKVEGLWGANQKTPKIANVVIMLDCSGSMSSPQFKAIFSELMNLGKSPELTDTIVHMIPWGSRATYKRYKSLSRPIVKQLYQYGKVCLSGTYPYYAYEMLMQKVPSPDLILFLSDMDMFGLARDNKPPRNKFGFSTSYDPGDKMAGFLKKVARKTVWISVGDPYYDERIQYLDANYKQRFLRVDPSIAKSGGDDLDD